MSGFEVAGIALAVFPILVDGLVRFVDGVQTIKHWRRYRARHQECADIMGTQGVYYQDTLEQLLTDIVQSEDEITELMAQPKGAIWKRPEYEEKLRQRLGRSYEVYLHTSNKMVKALCTMCEKLGVDTSGKVGTKSRSIRQRHRRLNMGGFQQVLPDDSSRVEREMKRIKVTLSKNIHKEALDMIDKANKDLRDITHQNIYLEPHRKKRRSRRPLAELKLVRKHATSLYHVFITGKAWKCSCNMLHMASLRLESRPEVLEAVNADTAPKMKFRILLSTIQARDSPRTTSQWQEVEVIPSLDKKVPDAISVGPQTSTRGVRFGTDPASIPTASSPQEPATEYDCGLIHDMCSTLCARHESKKPMGFLVDEEDDTHKHYVYRTNTTIGPESRSKSLGDLLSCSGHGSSSAPLLRSHRLRIAVTLASSVLQLDGTSWLKSQWRSKDIFFHEKSNDASHPSYPYPYLTWKLCMTDSNISGSFDSLFCGTFMIRSEVLYALGLTLIELCFGKTLTEMHVPEDGDPNESTTEMKTAHRLCSSVYSEMGTRYGDAVWRCLYQPFDVRDMSLDNEQLQQKVFDDIVTPLSDDLTNFNGRSRIK